VFWRKNLCFYLDEATASIDPFTEKQIQTALNLILKQSTSVLIAHRLSDRNSPGRPHYRIDEGVILERAITNSCSRAVVIMPTFTILTSVIKAWNSGKAGQIFHSNKIRFPPPRQSCCLTLISILLKLICENYARQVVEKFSLDEY
jgi:energy-coupling factor transporter ATP-binding protein EcfA2